MIVIGDKEADSKKVSIRLRSGETMNDLVLNEAINMILEDIQRRQLQPGKLNKPSQEVSH